jgi:tRNA(Ile)-lysidine synthase TilS/MesJ
MATALLLGYSGGQDSALAFFLLQKQSLEIIVSPAETAYEIQSKVADESSDRNINLQVFHANHNSRFSSLYTTFETRKLCACWETPCSIHTLIHKKFVENWVRPSNISSNNSSLIKPQVSEFNSVQASFKVVAEAKARVWRYTSWQRTYLYEKFVNKKPLTCITAHTATDKVETSLFNLFRGKTPQTLVGFSNKAYSHPFDGITRWETKKYCSLYCLPISLDLSNFQLSKFESTPSFYNLQDKLVVDELLKEKDYLGSTSLDCPRRNQIRQFLVPLCTTLFSSEQLYSSKVYSFQQFLSQDLIYLKKLVNYIYNYNSFRFLPIHLQRYCAFNLLEEYLQ